MPLGHEARARGRGYYTYFGYGDAPLRRVSIFTIFDVRNGIDFHDFRNWYRVEYAIPENWYKVNYTG